MRKLFDFFRNFFDGGHSNQNRLPFLHETIDLKSYPTEKVELWKSEGGYQSFSDLINSTYREILIIGKQKSSSKSISILELSHSNGWFLHCEHLKYQDSNYKYFAHELSNKLKDHGYVIQLAELKSIASTNGIELITHYYLKPSIKNRFNNNGNLASQLFGNITIEYKTIDGLPKSFKFLAKAYMDSKFLPPQDFNELQKIIFEG